jgi:hypothetical protein
MCVVVWRRGVINIDDRTVIVHSVAVQILVVRTVKFTLSSRTCEKPKKRSGVVAFGVVSGRAIQLANYSCYL